MQKLQRFIFILMLLCVFNLIVFADGPGIVAKPSDSLDGRAEVAGQHRKSCHNCRQKRKRHRRAVKTNTSPQAQKVKEEPASGANLKLDPEDAQPSARPTPKLIRKQP